MADKILVIDDEEMTVQLITILLERRGYEVVKAYRAEDGLRKAYRTHPDLILLDIMMPDMDGWEVCRRLRELSDVPIIFLTARVDDIDKITGLEIGADEYITKPFSPRVLVAHVRAVLRRAYGDLSSEPTVWRVGDLELNAETRLVTKGGQRVDLTPSEFDLLAVLIGRPDRVFTRMELLERVQGDAFAGYERTIDVHVKNLRAKIEDDPRQPQFIETVYGVGYRMRSHHE